MLKDLLVRRRIVVAAIICLAWILGSLSTLVMAVEFPGPLFNIHLRTYPGMFLWPLFFLPVVGIFLMAPLRLVWTFLHNHSPRPTVAKAVFLLPMIMIPAGMSGYEWVNGKYAVWELAPSVSRQQPPTVARLAPQLDAPSAVSIRSFDQWAMSIRARPPAQDYLDECRFGGRDMSDYLQQRCHCAPLNQATLGGQCDRVRQVWYDVLREAVADPRQRSYTYYFYRLSFTVMAIVFVAALVGVAYMETYAPNLKTAYRTEYKRAKTHMHVVAMFCVIWWIQRLYFGYEQFKIFPYADDSVFLTFVLSLMIGVPIIIGLLHAFGQDVKALRSFMENLLFPVLTLGSTLIGMVWADMAARMLRVVFGVDASPAALVAFITFSFGICLIPLLHFLRDSGMPAFSTRSKLRRGTPKK